MKTFLISIGVTVVMFVLVGLNMCMVNRETDALFSLIEELPQSTESYSAFDSETLGSLTDGIVSRWESGIERFSSTLGYDNVNRASDAVNELSAAYTADDSESYIRAADKLRDALERLRMMENISFDSIF